MGLLVDMGGDDLLVNNIITTVAGQGGSSTSGTIIAKFEANAYILTATSATFTAFVNDNLSGTFKVAAVSTVFSTASTSGTVQVEVATGTQAPGSGTNQLSSALALSGTANTPANGTIVAAPTTITAGSRVNVVIAGTMTNLVNGVVTIALQRIS